MGVLVVAVVFCQISEFGHSMKLPMLAKTELAEEYSQERKEGEKQQKTFFFLSCELFGQCHRRLLTWSLWFCHFTTGARGKILSWAETSVCLGRTWAKRREGQKRRSSGSKVLSLLEFQWLPTHKGRITAFPDRSKDIFMVGSICQSKCRVAPC